jgi:hypothetical protein
MVIMMTANQDQLIKSRAHDEIRASLLSIQKVLRQLGDLQVCVLHCMQPHRLDFYERLEREFDVRVHIEKRRVGLRAFLSRVAFGPSALVVLSRYEELSTLFLRISEQAMAALYVVPKSILEALPEMARLSPLEVSAEMKRFPTHLLYQVDEDAAGVDGRTIEIVSVGPDCPQLLKEAVGISAAVGPAG